MNGLHIFLNGERGASVLRAVLDAGHGVDSIIVPAGQRASVIKDFAGRVFAPVDVRSAAFMSELVGLAPSLFVVAGFSTIFPASLLNLPAMGTINLHGGRLPAYRGGSPLNWQIINGESRIGISVIRMDTGIDTGPVLAETGFPLGASGTIADAHRKANELFPALTLQAIAALEADPHAGRAQDEASARYWHQRRDGDGRLRFDVMTASEIDRMVRALTRPYPGAFAVSGARKIRVFGCEIPAFPLHGVPGRVCWVQGRGPYVVCADRAILLTDYPADDGEPVKLRDGFAFE